MYDWSKQHRFIVYALVDPQTHDIRYIGRSSMGHARPIEHATRIARERTHKAAWVRSLQRRGLEYDIRVLQECDDQASTIVAEIRWIRYGRSKGWPLTNMTSGGEGASAKKLQLPTTEIAARYAAGESELALAKAYGVQRWTIRRRLVESGVEIRGRSAAHRLRMQRLTAAERRALAFAANEATRAKHRQ